MSVQVLAPLFQNLVRSLLVENFFREKAKFDNFFPLFQEFARFYSFHFYH